MSGFSSVTFERGERYFLEGRVRSVGRHGERVMGLVRGNAGALYTVVIDPEAPHKSTCTCPVRNSCKHAVALFLAWLEQIYQQDRPPSPRVEALPAAPPEISLDIDRLLEELSAKTDASNRPVQRIRASHLERDDAQWRAAFLAGPRGAGICLSAVRQYRRKDGSYGRLELLEPYDRVSHADEACRRLCDLLLLVENVAPLPVFAENLLETRAPVFYGSYSDPTGAQRHRIQILKPARLELRVIPLLIDTAFGVPEGAAIFGSCGLGLELEAHHSGGSISMPAATALAGETTAGHALLLAAERALLIDREDAALAVLATHASRSGLLSLAAIEAFERAAVEFGDAFRVSRPNRVRTVAVPVEPVFCVEAGRAWAELSLRYEPIESVPDGYHDGEYLLHTAGNLTREDAYDDACEIVGGSPFTTRQNGSVVWSLAEDDDSEADPVTAVTALAKRGYTIYIEEGGRRRRARSSTLSVSVRSGIDWFELETRDSEDRAVGREEFAALRARGWYERDGEAILLDATTIKRLEGVLALREEMPHGIPATDIASIAEAAALADRYDESVRAVVSLVSSLESDHSTASTPVPITLSGRLRSYQHVGFQHLTRLALHGLSACLADDMGLGKTIQTLAFMLHLREQKPSTFLVIAPVSTLGNWAREAARFAPSLTARVHHGGDRAGTADELDNAELVVTSYATAQRDFELLSKREWDLLCLDEAQFIKNPLAKRRKIITKIPSRLRLCLTGTPVENITTDLWSIIDFLVPGLLGTMPEFHRRFPKRRSSDRSDNRLERLRRIVSPFVLRRTKEAVAPELPPKIEMTRTCTMGAKQRAFYRRLKEHHRSIVANAILSGDIKAIGAAVFTGLLRLRQAALYPEDAEREGAGVPSTKEEELLSQLEENCAEGHKALVFSQFVSALRRLRDRAVASGVETYYLDGKTTDRESEISGFQNTSGAAVFFVSLKAGGTGINLTAADYVYLCDPWWNPQVERQAVDRAHRIGREKPVVVTKLITAQTVEEKVLELQDQKRELASALITENQGGLSFDDPAELLSLFE